MVNLRRGIQADVEDFLHEVGGGFLERRDAVVCIAAIFHLIHFALQDLSDERVSHVVIFADAEVQQAALGMGGQGGSLGALDLLEFVDLGALAIVGAAEPLGKEFLEPGIAGHGRFLKYQCPGQPSLLQDSVFPGSGSP
jgi:hypothetical protein